jgi:hypothetical protein
MIGFVKNLITGILDFFIGLLRGKKPQLAELDTKTPELPGKVTGKTKRRSGFYLELDETNEPTHTSAAPATPPIAVAPPKPEVKTPVVAAKTELVQTAKGVKAEPVKPTVPQEPIETTFAPKYLAPNGSSNGRRRPGANMGSYIDMARDVKTAKS